MSPSTAPQAPLRSPAPASTRPPQYQTAFGSVCSDSGPPHPESAARPPSRRRTSDPSHTPVPAPSRPPQSSPAASLIHAPPPPPASSAPPIARSSPLALASSPVLPPAAAALARPTR